MALLEIRGLTTTYRTDEGPLRAVDGIDLDVEPGRVLGLVGESGCGKSAAALSVMRLLPASAELGGSIRFADRELVGAPEEDLRALRGAEMAMIFQDPMTSLNPVMTIGWQLEEAIRLHGRVPRREARARARTALEQVGIPSPEQRLRSYPHELSGGMRQRVMIAMALLNRPRLLIADEPTTALDVTTQAQILALVGDLRREVDAAVLLITHDLGVVAGVCDDVAVMYGGRIVERAPVDDLFRAPQHPYTWGLLESLPGRGRPGDRLRQIPGAPPDLRRPPAGCRFAPRCAHVLEACRRAPGPTLEPATGPRGVACLLDAGERARLGALAARTEAEGAA